MHYQRDLYPIGKGHSRGELAVAIQWSSESIAAHPDWDWRLEPVEGDRLLVGSQPTQAELLAVIRPIIIGPCSFPILKAELLLEFFVGLPSASSRSALQTGFGYSCPRSRLLDRVVVNLVWT